MKFPNVIGKKDIIHAAIIGSVAGLAGVLFFIVILSSMNSTQEQQTAQTDEELIPVQSPEEAVVDSHASAEFFANQHGVFSSFNAATEFIAGFASLNTSDVVEIDGNFYVWSSVSPIKEELVISDNPTSFAKSFTFSGAACTDPKLQSLPTHLESNDPSKFYFDEAQVPDTLPDDWQTVTSALSSISGDLSVARLHLITHYSKGNDCLKIEL